MLRIFRIPLPLVGITRGLSVCLFTQVILALFAEELLEVKVISIVSCVMYYYLEMRFHIVRVKVCTAE